MTTTDQHLKMPLLLAIALLLAGCAIDTSAPDVGPLPPTADAGADRHPIPSRMQKPGNPPCYPVLGEPDGTDVKGTVVWYCPPPEPCGVECYEEIPHVGMEPDPVSP